MASKKRMPAGLLDPESEAIAEAYAAIPSVRKQTRGLLSLDPQEDQGMTQAALEAVLGFIPGISQALAVRDIERARRANDPAAAAMAATEFVPFGRIGGALRRDIFIGKNAKTWDANAAKRAEELEASGANPESIWRETGTFRAPDGELRQEISDVGSRLVKESESGLPSNVAFEHPGGLYQAYPDIGKQTIIRTGQPLEDRAIANYNPDAQLVSFGKNAPQNQEELAAVGLHELQHAIQSRENFSRGGTTGSARRLLKEDIQSRYEPYSSDLYKRSWANISSGQAHRANYAQYLEKLQKKDSPKPRDLTNLSDWYQYGTRVSQEMGEDGYGWQMPRKSGADRDSWIRQAARRMQRMIEADRPDMRNAEKSMSEAEAKKILRKTNKVFKETQESAIAASKLRDFENTLESKSDYDLYQRLLGEAEARAVEKRMNLTPQQRREIFPEYDVPLNEIIISRK